MCLWKVPSGRFLRKLQQKLGFGTVEYARVAPAKSFIAITLRNS